MKKSVHFIFTFFLILFFYGVSMAQTSAAKQKHADVFKVHQERRAQGLVQPETNTAPKGVPTSSTFQVDENDPYQGRREEFLSLLTVKELPADFPKYNKSYGIKGYNFIIDDYLANHKNIVIESVKMKLEAQGR